MNGYIVAIDQSTSASKVFLTDENARIVRRFSKPHRQYYPCPGGAEHDAEEIWQNVREGISAVTDGIDRRLIKALSVCNQRETTVFWDKSTGLPLRNAIVWQDVRASLLCAALSGEADYVKLTSGLGLSPYYPAGKAAFALNEDPALGKRAAGGDALIGTVDSYLIFRLTGGRRFCQDVSNASRTQLFDIYTGGYDDRLCEIFGVPRACLPEVLPSDGEFGEVSAEGLPAGVPITGVMGDSHASLFAQRCTEPGMVKTSYGTGSSVMMNTGAKPLRSSSGLSTSVAYGYRGVTKYVLEGNITHSGDTLRWLCDEAELCASPAEVERVALSVKDSGGVFLVPAFSGMGAPYFDADARAAFVGMSRQTSRAQLVRAALESMAYQNADVIYAMQKDAGCDISVLHADGGGCGNETLMRFQADLLGCPLMAARESELSALGSAMMAGEKAGLYDIKALEPFPTRLYTPAIDAARREELMNGWHAAVRIVLGK